MRAELPREAFKILICRWSLRTDTYINTRGNSTSAKFFDAVVNNKVTVRTLQPGHFKEYCRITTFSENKDSELYLQTDQ